MQKTTIATVVAAGASLASTGWNWVVPVSASPSSGVNPVSSVETNSTAPHIVGRQSPMTIEPTSTYSRTEIDAKLEVAAAKAETARVGLDGKIDLVLAGIEGLRAKLHEEVEAVKNDNKTTRTVTLVTIVVSVIAAIGAIYAAQANNLAALQIGIERGAAVASAPTGTKK